MHPIQKPQKATRFFFHPVVLAILALLTVYFASSVFQIARKSKEAKENRMLAANELEKLEERQQVLSAEIARLETEEGVEEALREKFRIMKEGEGVIVIVDPEIPLSETSGKQNQTFWAFLAGLFK